MQCQLWTVARPKTQSINCLGRNLVRDLQAQVPELVVAAFLDYAPAAARAVPMPLHLASRENVEEARDCGGFVGPKKPRVVLAYSINPVAPSSVRPRFPAFDQALTQEEVVQRSAQVFGKAGAIRKVPPSVIGQEDACRSVRVDVASFNLRDSLADLSDDGQAVREVGEELDVDEIPVQLLPRRRANWKRTADLGTVAGARYEMKIRVLQEVLFNLG